MNPEPTEAQTRMFRIARTPPAVEYGWWRTTGKTKRFEVLRRWPASDMEQARLRLEELRVTLFTELDQELPDVDAKPIPARHHIRRDFAAAPAEIHELIEAARKGLDVEELPTIEESHAKLKADVPQPNGAGRQFYVYLNEPIYQKLVAMSAAARVTRNRLIEALVLLVATSEEETTNGRTHQE